MAPGDPRGHGYGEDRMAALLAQPAPVAAPALLGWELSCQGVTGCIAEVEAYQGEEDRACHASRGRTPRTLPLYAPCGTLYVYLCYGMHHLLNLVTDRHGVPSAVLIRGLLIPGLDPRYSNGPGKVARLLSLDRRQSGLRLGDRDCPLALRPGRTPNVPIACGTRVGVAYAGPEWAGKPWRWWLTGFPAVSH